MSRLEEVKKNYPNLDWEKYKEADISKNGKYLKWIGDNALSVSPTLSITDIKDLLNSFERCKDKLSHKDIYLYNLSALKEELEKLSPSRKEQKEEGSTDLGEIDGYRIIYLQDFNAAKMYTAGTKWCISNKEEFESYIKTNNIFIITRNAAKMALVLGLSKKNDFELFDTDDECLVHSSYKRTANLLSFFGLNEVISVCSEFSKTHKSFFAEKPDKDLGLEYLLKLEKRGDYSHYFSHYDNSLPYNKVIKFIKAVLSHKEQLPNLLLKLSKDNNVVFVKREWKSIKNIFKKLNTDKIKLKKPDIHSIVLNKVKKKGGLKKLLKTEESVQKFEKFLQEINAA